MRGYTQCKTASPPSAGAHFDPHKDEGFGDAGTGSFFAGQSQHGLQIGFADDLLTCGHTWARNVCHAIKRDVFFMDLFN